MVKVKEIIERRPHLRDPLRIYEKVLQFQRAAAGLCRIPGTPPEPCYPLECREPVLERFASIFGFSEEILAPLGEAMRLGHVDFTRLPLNEVPAFSLPYHEDELAQILFLLGKPYFLAQGESFREGNLSWQEGRCPVCHAAPAIAVLAQEGRRLHCSFCGTEGFFKRVGCPVRPADDASKIRIFTFQDEEGFRVDGCDECGTYVKTITADLLKEMSPDLADMVSLPLDIVAQGKGYRRLSPNPIGITKVV